MKGIVILGMCMLLLSFSPVADEMCSTCEELISECVCEEELLTEETMGTTLALPAVSAFQYGSIVVGAGVSIGAGFLYRKDKAYLMTRERRRLKKVSIHKRKNGYMVNLPSEMPEKDMLLQFKDNFVLKNEGCLLYIVYKNEEYETLISSEIHISQEENEK